MKKLLFGAVAIGLVVCLVAVEAFAWAPGRGGRSLGGGGRSPRPGGLPTPSGASPGRPDRAPTLAPSAGPKIPHAPIPSNPVRPTPGQGVDGGPRFPNSPIQSHPFDRPIAPDKSGVGNLQDQLGNPATSAGSRAGELATAYGWTGSAYAPFSPAWYAQHPNAWQLTHPYAGEAVVAASALVVANWLSVSEAAVSSSGYTSAATEPASPEEAAQAAGELATSGAMEVADATQWLPVGVYAFQPADSPQATRLLQLAVSPEGILRGSHFDLISDEATDIRGAVDKTGLSASWTIGHTGKVVFQCPVGELTKPDGQVTAFFPDGQTGVWRIAQFTN